MDDFFKLFSYPLFVPPCLFRRQKRVLGVGDPGASELGGNGYWASQWQVSERLSSGSEGRPVGESLAAGSGATDGWPLDESLAAGSGATDGWPL